MSEETKWLKALELTGQRQLAKFIKSQAARIEELERHIDGEGGLFEPTDFIRHLEVDNAALREKVSTLSATAEVVEHLLSAGNAMHTCAEASRAYERSDDLADAMDTWENMQVLAAEAQAETEPAEE